MSTVGYGDILPSSDKERGYNIVAMVFGVAFYSYIIASISSLVQQKDAKKAMIYEKMEAVNAWVGHHDLDPHLRRRVRTSLRLVYETRTTVDEKEILENLQPVLQDELCQELLSAAVLAHPLFDDFPQGALYKIVCIVRHDAVHAAQMIMAAGMPTSSLYVLTDGYCDAECYDAKGDDAEKTVRTFAKGSSFGEYAVLGLYPTSMVTVTTRTPCSFDRIQQDMLFDAFAGLPGVLAAMRARVGSVAPSGCRCIYE